MNTRSRDQAPKILIVEDERIVAMDLAGTLTELGYQVAGMVTRGEDAIAKAATDDIDLILMDVRLAGKIDGIQAAQTIRESRDIPVIYLTAHSDNDTLRRAVHSAASGYLVKPFKSPELRCAIEIAIHKHAIDVKLRENEQWLTTTLESITDAVIATDEEGQVRLFNRIAQNLTGWPSQEAKQRPLDQVLALVDEQTGVPAENPVHRALELREPVHVPEGAALISRSGDAVAVEEAAAPIVDPYGRLLGGVLVLRDITERRRQMHQIQKLNAELEQRVAQRTSELEAANQDLEAFSYSVAHDLRAPLRGIQGFSRLLLDEHSGGLDTEGARHLERICAETNRMSQLIDALLGLSRIGRSRFEAVDVDLTAMVESLAVEVAAAHPGAHAALRVEPHMHAHADPHLLRLALNNLLDNAWKFSSRIVDPLIEVGMDREARIPTYFVRDNGAGFDPARAERLFVPFQRLHSPREFSGTGVGLTIVHRVISRHGGRVWAESQPGNGATFYFTLPQPAR